MRHRYVSGLSGFISLVLGLGILALAASPASDEPRQPGPDTSRANLHDEAAPGAGRVTWEPGGVRCVPPHPGR